MFCRLLAFLLLLTACTPQAPVTPGGNDPSAQITMTVTVRTLGGDSINGFYIVKPLHLSFNDKQISFNKDASGYSILAGIPGKPPTVELYWKSDTLPNGPYLYGPENMVFRDTSTYSATNMAHGLMQCYGNFYNNAYSGSFYTALDSPKYPSGGSFEVDFNVPMKILNQ